MANKVTALPIDATVDTRRTRRSGIDAAVRPPAWPGYGLINDLLPVLDRWHRQGNRAALATLIGVKGSSPRPIGSEMAINDVGEIAGYVSGGCVEAVVAGEAREVLRTGKPVLLDYGAGSPVLDVQLTCGGRIGIFVRALPDLAAYVSRWSQARAERAALEVDIDLRDGTHEFMLQRQATPGGPRFRQRYLPPPRLIVVGGDPVTLALCRLAPGFGFETVLLRPYGPASPPPGTDLQQYDPRALARALKGLTIDAWSAVYALTHDIDDDHQILLTALRSGAFCVGVLGSRGKTADRAARLRADGIGDADIARLKTPAGVNIGATNPQEIALSILAETIRQRPRAIVRASP